MAQRSAPAKLLIAIDPTKNPFDPLRLGGKLARRTRLPVVLVTVFPHHPLFPGPEDQQQRAVRADARKDLLELGRSFDGPVVDDALVLASSSPA